MIPVSSLPTLNAVLNGTSAVLLVTGWLFIHGRRVAAHKTCMLAAFAVSVVFLTSYLYYHAQVGSVPFTGTGWSRPVYFTILLTHTVLAVIVPFAALVTIYRAFRGQFERHRRLARITLPVWIYVSVTGVVIYVMLYHLFASPAAAANASRPNTPTTISDTGSGRPLLSAPRSAVIP